MKKSPDQSFRTGIAIGHDVYIWNCYEGKRVIIYKHTSEWSGGPAQKVTAQCGEKATIEIEFEKESKRDLQVTEIIERE